MATLTTITRIGKPQTAMEVEHTTPIIIPVELICENDWTTTATTTFTATTSTTSRNQTAVQQHEQQQASAEAAAALLSSQQNEGILPSRFTITMDSMEQQVFDILQQTATALEEGRMQIPTRPNCQRVEIRVAGGWVRDKLLGLSTHDVDIALDSCTGVEFATLVQDYMEMHQRGHPKMGIIAANPSQSKHLETATMNLYGVDVDFSNLRHELYQDDSRIPSTTVIGTPLEDAYRRDFTMNSLYYHLQYHHIEDWTRRALADLFHDRLVATPLEAYQTFHDDPLRVLRAIRFAVRYNMDMEDDIQQACQNPQIHYELHRKVSRERVGKELEGMLSGKGANPGRALETIFKLKLAGCIFCVPPMTSAATSSSSSTTTSYRIHGMIGLQNPKPYVGESLQELAHLREWAWEEAAQCLLLVPQIVQHLQLQSLDSTDNHKASTTSSNNPDGKNHQRHHHHQDGHSHDNTNHQDKTPTNNTMSPTPINHRLLYLAVFCLPFMKLTYLDDKHRLRLVAEYMMRDGIKFKNKDCQAMVTMMEHVEAMVQLLQTNTAHHTTTITMTTSTTCSSISDTTTNTTAATADSVDRSQLRLEAGLVVRDTKDLWVTTLILATVVVLRRQQEPDLSQISGPSEEPLPSSSSASSSSPLPLHWFTRAKEWYDTIQKEFQLDGCWKEKPMLDGKTMIDVLGLPKGPLVGFFTQEQIKWRLKNPHGSRQDCINHLRALKQEQDQQANETMEHIDKKMHL